MIRFDAPRDRRVQVTSRIVLGGLAAVAAGVVLLGLALSRGEPELLWPFLLCPAIIAVVVGTTYLLAPRGFAILGRELVVERRLHPLRIELSAIRVVGPLPAERIAGAVRLGGSGGLFGYFGWYSNRRLGAFRMYASRRSGLVLVETETEAFVLSPGNPDAFTEALRARAPAARGWAGGASTRPHRFPAARLLRSVGLALAAVLALVTSLFALIWGLAPVGARVTAEAVRVERRWVPALELPLSGVRDAEVMAPQYARGWWRTNGTAIGQVRYGRFASRELGPFRLFAWRYGPYVLLETNEGRVVLTPDEPERFVAEVRKRLGAR
ncbi:MAG TPA: PH domain-containing protein [Candidatus Sulfotelmatobacter sp.]|nr:PH domain-containing protein [Candidatus Sulfotelmatobacter sp.]